MAALARSELHASASTRAPVAAAWQGWRPDAAAVVGFVVVVAYVLPARLVLNGLGAAGRPALLLGAGLLGWWALARLVPGFFIPGRNPLRVALFVYVVAFLGSVLVGFARDMPVFEVSGADRALLRTLGLIGITLVVCDGIRTKERLGSLLRTYLAAVAFMAAIGTLQFVADLDLTPRLRVPGLSANGELIGIAARGADLNRVAGTAGHYIEFGVLLALAVPIALHFGFYSVRRVHRYFYLVLAAWLVLASFYSVSRSAVVCLAIVAMFSATGWPWRRKINIAVLGVLFLVVVRAFQPGLLGTLRSLFTNVDNDPSIEGRTNDYEVVAPLIADRPWFGRGPGTYSPDDYVLLDNEWLSHLITNGIVGVLALAAVLVTGAALAARVGRWAACEGDRNLGRALTASIVGAAVISGTFDSLSFGTFSVTLFLLLGAAGALWRLTGRPRPGDRTPAPGVPQ